MHLPEAHQAGNHLWKYRKISLATLNIQSSSTQLSKIIDSQCDFIENRKPCEVSTGLLIPRCQSMLGFLLAQKRWCKTLVRWWESLFFWPSLPNHYTHDLAVRYDLSGRLPICIWLIKSPPYTGGDFMFLCRYVRCSRCRHRWPQNLVHVIILNNFLDFFHFWHDCWPWPIDYLIWFWSIFVMTLTLNFQGQIGNLLYLSQNWFGCHETKNKHIDWTPGLKHDQWVWPWLWPWSLNFQGHMWPGPSTTHMALTMDFHGQILKKLYLRMGGAIDIEQRGGSRSFMTMTKVTCKDLPDSDRGNFRCRHAVDSSSYVS